MIQEPGKDPDVSVYHPSGAPKHVKKAHPPVVWAHPGDVLTFANTSPDPVDCVFPPELCADKHDLHMEPGGMDTLTLGAVQKQVQFPYTINSLASQCPLCHTESKEMLLLSATTSSASDSASDSDPVIIVTP